MTVPGPGPEVDEDEERRYCAEQPARFKVPTVGRTGPELRAIVSAPDVARFAAAAGQDSPAYTSVEAARAAGYEDLRRLPRHRLAGRRLVLGLARLRCRLGHRSLRPDRAQGADPNHLPTYFWDPADQVEERIKVFGEWVGQYSELPPLVA